MFHWQCLGIVNVWISRRCATIGATQQAVARRQHSRAALGGTADSLRWLAEYGKNHAVSLTFTHVNERDTDLTHASVTVSTRKKTEISLSHSTSVLRARHEAARNSFGDSHSKSTCNGRPSEKSLCISLGNSHGRNSSVIFLISLHGSARHRLTRLLLKRQQFSPGIVYSVLATRLHGDSYGASYSDSRLIQRLFSHGSSSYIEAFSHTASTHT